MCLFGESGSSIRKISNIMEWKQDMQSRFAVNEIAQESSSTDTSKMDTQPRENSLIKLRCREDKIKHCLLLAWRIKLQMTVYAFMDCMLCASSHHGLGKGLATAELLYPQQQSYPA